MNAVLKNYLSIYIKIIIYNYFVTLLKIGHYSKHVSLFQAHKHRRLEKSMLGRTKYAQTFAAVKYHENLKFYFMCIKHFKEESWVTVKAITFQRDVN